MKRILVIIDGMDDERIEALGGLTPREAAFMPGLARMRRHGLVGQVSTIPSGNEPGTDVALLNILGYNVPESFSSRSWLEALGQGVETGSGDLWLRCNLISHSGGIVTSHCGRGVSDEEAREAVEILNAGLGAEDLTFYHGTGFRNLLVVKGCDADVSAVAPHRMPECRLEDLKVRSSDSVVADRLNGCVEGAIKLLEGRRANGIALWSPGRAVSFDRKTPGAVVAGVGLVKGIGRAVGMDVVEVAGATGDASTDYRAKCDAAMAALARHDFVLLHVEAADEASHSRDYRGKVRILEDIDRDIISVLLESGIDAELTVQADHGTSSLTGCHLCAPVERVTCRIVRKSV